MYLTFRRYKIDPKDANEILKRVNEGFVPILSNAIGFVSYSIFLDEFDHICSVSTFTTRAGMEEASLMAKDWVDEHLTKLMPNPPDVSKGETILHKRGTWS